MKLLSYFSLLCTLLILKSCANISPPTGGPKDIRPPKLIRSVPKANSTNFAGKSILLEFNEKVALNAIEEQLIINPIPKGEYISTVQKNKVNISFKEALNPNTTYTFNFRDAIQDITEKNIVPNLYLAFSTGQETDSCILKGSVKDYLSNVPLEHTIISLYKHEDTVDIQNGKPLYFTKSNKLGAFELKNIKEGDYKLYALQDLNKNFIYDLEEEKIAFKDSIYIKSIYTIDLNLIKNSIKGLSILNQKRVSINEYAVNMSKGVEVQEIIYSINKKPILHSSSEDGRTIYIYNTQLLTDSIPINLIVKDSSGKVLNTSINIFFGTENKDSISTKKGQKIDKQKITYINPIKKINPADIRAQNGSFSLSFLFSKPILKENTASIRVKKDTIPISNTLLTLAWNKTNTELRIKGNISFKDSLVLFIPERTFININGDSSKQNKLVITNKKEEEFAVLSGTVKTVTTNYLLQLIDSKFQVLDSIYNPTKFTFSFIPPGIYYLRCIVDLNKNHMWDGGDIEKKEQPEPIIFYKEKFELRANWEITDVLFAF